MKQLQSSYNETRKTALQLLDNFKIFFIETYSLKEAYLTFSTLNNRGKPLKQADLLKNYLKLKK